MEAPALVMHQRRQHLHVRGVAWECQVSSLFFSLIAIGVVLIYLGLPNQAWFANSLSTPPWRVSAAACIALGVACGLARYSLAVVVFVVIAVSMAVMTIMPFLALLRRSRNSK